MKKLVAFLFCIFLFFIGGFTVARIQPQIIQLFQNDASTNCFKPTLYPLQNHRFVITIIGRNNGAYIEKTLRSVLSQNYDPFRVIYIDDASTDGSFYQAREVINESGLSSKIRLIQNDQPLGAISNLYRAAKDCADEEILVVVNGEDLLAHEWVLQRLNQYYANPDLWMTYGKYLELPSFSPGKNIQDLDTKNARNTTIPPLHLKTFYAGLFKNIEEDDLIYQGEFVPDSADVTYIVPLFELAENHVQYLNEVLYLVTKYPRKDEEYHYNLEVSLRERASYAPLDQLFEMREQ